MVYVEVLAYIVARYVVLKQGLLTYQYEGFSLQQCLT